MNHILFAIPYDAPRERREVARHVVAGRFDGIAVTTQLVGERDYGRLYRMDRTPKNEKNPSMREPVEKFDAGRMLAMWALLGHLASNPLPDSP